MQLIKEQRLTLNSHSSDCLDLAKISRRYDSYHIAIAYDDLNRRLSLAYIVPPVYGHTRCSLPGSYKSLAVSAASRIRWSRSASRVAMSKLELAT
jgi:hypothetical protein